MRSFLLIIACVLAFAMPAQAARLLSQVSNDSIEITSSFDGERMNFFGTIVPDAGAPEKYVEGPFQVVIVVLGPTQDRVARQMTHNLASGSIPTSNCSRIFRAISTCSPAIGCPTSLIRQRLAPT
jgi:hypothetical protein